ncbi:MAG TPA: DUF4326 domain-containing protein [Acidimicrobiales bacterium]|nr:DUF4326 domain-containing protein [Acidimicrobiales bacterium]
MTPQRIQLSRKKGYRKPEGAVNCTRPGKFGNPFPVDGPWIMWIAVALGFRADKAGRRAAAVALHRAWLTGGKLRVREFDPIAGTEFDGGGLEFADGTLVSMADACAGFALLGVGMAEPPTLPPVPDVSDLRGKDCACWCGPDQECHVTVLMELANS